MATKLKVQFGGVSIGDATARLGCSIDRTQISIEDSDRNFCGRRLIGRVVLGHTEDDLKQLKIKDTDYTVDGAFDIKSISVKPGTVGFGLTFSRADIDIADLGKFAKSTGLLIIDKIEEIPKPEKASKEPTGPKLFSEEGTWEAVPLDTIFIPRQAVRKRLAAAGIDTLGQLQAFLKRETTYLTDLDGIGEVMAGKISDQLAEFWAANPQYAESAGGAA